MLNSVAAGRRQAGRAIAWQVGATLLVALACLWQGLHWSAAALVGGGAVVLAMYVGGLFQSWWAFAAILLAILWVHVGTGGIRLGRRRGRR